MSENLQMKLAQKPKDCDDEFEMAITQAAVTKVQSLGAQHGKNHLRIRISSGGCSGFQYHFGFAEYINEDDVYFTYDDVTIVIDAVSMELINGITLDYAQDLIGAAFTLKNPNASVSCGCGNSFGL